MVDDLRFLCPQEELVLRRCRLSLVLSAKDHPSAVSNPPSVNPIQAQSQSQAKEASIQLRIGYLRNDNPLAMYTTIEPRLIALLNDGASEPYTPSPSLELPPLHDPNILKASGRPLLLEPDTRNRTNKPNSSSQLVLQHPALISSFDENDNRHENSEARKKSRKDVNSTDRALGSTSPQSLRKILDGDSASKKRHMEGGKDDFVQLPQPPKKQKTAKQVVPPIIIGLFEPPPQAALFPPIASSSFHDSHGRNSLNIVTPTVKEPRTDISLETTPPSVVQKKETPTKANKRKNPKAYKKWAEEETAHLLKGLKKHGLGNWSDILGDPEFSFNNRTAVDLKDRWRTIAPVELRGKPKSRRHGICSEKNKHKTSVQARSKSSLMSENILIEADDLERDATPNADSTSHSPSKKMRRRRNHRKNLEDLANLGINGPLKKSHRRERRPFSDEDDRHILEGYKLYGPQWTKIQKDPRFHLQSRTPTDLRDRYRNKYSDKTRQPEDSSFKDINQKDGQEKENVSLDETPPSSSLQTSSSRECLKIQQMISSQPEDTSLNAVSLQPQTTICSFKDNFLSISEQPGAVEPNDTLPFTQSFDWNEGIAAPFTSNMGEMDISRLLLEEPWGSENVSGFNGGKKQSYTNISSICTSSSDPLPQVMSFTNLLACESEPIVNLPSSAALEHDGSFGWKSTMLSHPGDATFTG